MRSMRSSLRRRSETRSRFRERHRETEAVITTAAAGQFASRAMRNQRCRCCDPTMAEALVIEAVQSLDPEGVTGNAIRDAVVERLVQAQIAITIGSTANAPASLDKVSPRIGSYGAINLSFRRTLHAYAIDAWSNQ